MNHMIYDNVFDLDYRIYFYNVVSTLSYQIGWPDREDAHAKKYNHLHSHMSIEDLKECNFFEKIKNDELREFIKNKEPFLPVINLSHPCNVYFPHTHTNYYSLIYYVNIEWQSQWHGETVLYKENGIDISTSVSFVPNRILILNKAVPHALRPPSIACPDYRYTFACFLA